MKLCILTTEEQWEIDRISEEARARGHEVVVKSPEEVAGTEFDFTHLLLRVLKGQAEKGKQVAQAALGKGVKVVDRRLATEGGRNKWENQQLFSKAGLYCPKTLVVDLEKLEELEKIPGEEIVVKDVNGKRGEGVFKIKKSEIQELPQKLDTGTTYIAQEFVEIGELIRVVVVGDKALGAYEKKTEGWLKSVAQGAEPVKVALTKELEEASLKASRVVKTEISGVDIGTTSKGLFVLEANRSPQFQGFVKATGINVALEIVKYLESL